VRELEGRVALITGASRGIGAACARVMAREGADIAINYFRSESKAMAVAAQVADVCRRHLVVQADVKNPDQVRHMVDEILTQWGRIDILVNNAGRHDRLRFDAMTLDQYDDSVETNLTSQMLCIRAVIPGMKVRHWGRIVNITALTAQRGSYSGDAGYAVSKTGVVGLTRALFREVAAYKLNINAVAPGPIDTDMLRHGFSPERVGQLSERVPLQRLGWPEEVAEVVSFLCSDRASYVTGQLVPVNGGLYT
jgi:3-oxoacyl-[acyl-carrier protein] reductase